MLSDMTLAIGATFERGVGHISGARYTAGIHRRAKAEFLVVLMRDDPVAADSAEEDPC
jgi:hypothetical protein